jgi:hypothetical protein
LKPDYGPAYVPLARLAWARADWPTARDAFRQAYLYQEDEHSLALCAAVCSLRAGKPAEVSAVLTPVLPQLAADSWYRDTARFLMDRSAEPSFLGRINRERNAALKARMLFYYAEYCFANNMDRAGLTYLIQIEGKGAVSAPETQLASAELARRQSAQE